MFTKDSNHVSQHGTFCKVIITETKLTCLEKSCSIHSKAHEENLSEKHIPSCHQREQPIQYHKQHGYLFLSCQIFIHLHFNINQKFLWVWVAKVCHWCYCSLIKLTTICWYTCPLALVSKHTLQLCSSLFLHPNIICYKRSIQE